MPNHKSAEKRVRQTARKNEVNRNNRSRLRTAIKKLRAAFAAKDNTLTQELLTPTVSIIDKMVNKGILHRNTANRYKLRLRKHAENLSTATAQQ